MKHRSHLEILRLLALAFMGHSAPAFQHPDHAELPDLDLRRSTAPRTKPAAHDSKPP